jgi:hypothetical protein
MRRWVIAAVYLSLCGQQTCVVAETEHHWNWMQNGTTDLWLPLPQDDR